MDRMDLDPPPLTIVTGAAGWLGTALTEVLGARPDHGALRLGVLDDAEAERIRPLAPHASFVVGDLTAPGTAARLLMDADGADVLHTAGIIHPRTVADFERVNVGGTRAVLDGARAAGVRRLVHVSSNSPFGVNPTPQDTFSAEEPYHPYMGYGRSKMAAEQLVRAAHGDGLQTTVVRPPWFYGRHQPVRQTRFFTAIRTGRFPLVGDGCNRRSMVNTVNLVDGVLRAQRAAIAGGRAYWIADRRPYPMGEVVQTVREALRLEGYEVADRTPRLPRLAGTVAERLDGFLQDRGRYVQELHVLGEMDKTIACRIDAAERDLGYDPQIELLGGMRDAISWCRGQGIDL
jgi:nucleoside-diphosphate-sugar epimerase